MESIVVIVPVFVIAAAGYILAAFGVIGKSDTEGLSRFVFNVALPVMLFSAMARLDLPESGVLPLLGTYYASAVAVFAVAFLVARLVLGHRREEAAVVALGGSFSNTVFLGVPLVDAAFGATALVPLFVIVSIHSATMFTLVALIVESRAREGRSSGTLAVIGRSLASTAGNPIIIALALGVAVRATGLVLPVVVDRTIDLIRPAATPLALFVTGASLREYRLGGRSGDVALMLATKMVLLPLLVAALALWVFRLPPLWATVAIFAAALPTGSLATVTARRYQTAVAPVASATLIGTAAAVATTTFLVAQLNP